MRFVKQHLEIQKLDLHLLKLQVRKSICKSESWTARENKDWQMKEYLRWHWAASGTIACRGSVRGVSCKNAPDFIGLCAA